jgi:hypothetical protein
MTQGWCLCRGIAVTLRDHGSMEGLQFTNITIESLFYERLWLGGAEPVHITAMPRAGNAEVGTHTSSMASNSHAEFFQLPSRTTVSASAKCSYRMGQDTA